MLIQTDREARFSGRATQLPTPQAFLDALSACMAGEQARETLQVSYEVVEGEAVRVETINLILVTAVELHPFAEHMVVAAWDDKWMSCVLNLRRTSATSKEFNTNYIEIY